MPRRTGRVALVLELEIPLDGPMNFVRLTSSIPGREGTMSRVWATVDNRYGAQTWNDIQSAVLSQLSTCLELCGGIQLGLDL